jgi:hypothetical protein
LGASAIHAVDASLRQRGDSGKARIRAGAMASLRKWDSEKEREVYRLIWGETGTRDGATRLQLASVGWLWSRYAITSLHDGDCVGVDAQLYQLARTFSVDEIVMHPPTNPKFRAFCGLSDDGSYIRDGVTIEKTKPYFIRDRAMVDASGAMVACPKQYFELGKMTGGTWYTINYSRLHGKPLAVVWPNGLIAYENWDRMIKL